MLLSVVLLQNSHVEDYRWCGCVGVCMYVFTYSIIIFHWCHGSSTGLGIHDLIHYPNIKALLSSTGDATLEHLECAPGLSHVLGYLIIYCCHLLQGNKRGKFLKKLWCCVGGRV